MKRHNTRPPEKRKTCLNYSLLLPSEDSGSENTITQEPTQPIVTPDMPTESELLPLAQPTTPVFCTPAGRLNRSQVSHIGTRPNPVQIRIPRQAESMRRAVLRAQLGDEEVEETPEERIKVNRELVNMMALTQRPNSNLPSEHCKFVAEVGLQWLNSMREEDIDGEMEGFLTMLRDPSIDEEESKGIQPVVIPEGERKEEPNDYNQLEYRDRVIIQDNQELSDPDIAKEISKFRRAKKDCSRITVWREKRRYKSYYGKMWPFFLSVAIAHVSRPADMKKGPVKLKN